MNIEERSIDYLERLLAHLAEIEEMSDPLKKMQAKIDLRNLFVEALQEGRESIKEKSGKSYGDKFHNGIQNQIPKDRAPYSAQEYK